MRGALADGEAIRSRRKAAGFTQEELAKRASCDVKTVRKSEHDGRLDLGTLHRIAAALEVTSADITHDEDGSQAKREANLQTVLDWQDAFNRRDVDGMLQCWHDDGVLNIPGMEDLPAGGMFRGKEELRRHMEQTFQLFETELISRDMFEIHAVGDFVFMRGYASVLCIPTGQRMRSYANHEFRLEGNKIAEQLITTDTHGLHRIVEDGDATDE